MSLFVCLFVIVVLISKFSPLPLSVGCSSDLMMFFAGHPGPAQALVEDPTVHVGASAVWDLGWCVHILHDQHFRSCPFLEDRLAGGE